MFTGASRGSNCGKRTDGAVVTPSFCGLGGSQVFVIYIGVCNYSLRFFLIGDLHISFVSYVICHLLLVDRMGYDKQCQLVQVQSIGGNDC